MKEHIETYDFYVQNYIEEMFDGHSLEKKSFMNQTIFPKKSIFMSKQSQLKHYLNSSDSPFSRKKAEIFMEDLEHQEKLYEFLSYVCTNCCDQVAFEVLLIANSVWEQYLQIQSKQLSYQTLIEYSKILVEYNWKNIKNQKSIKYLTFEKTYIKPNLKNQERSAEQKRFVEFLIVTIFLVVSEFFSNPYYQQKVSVQLKRHVFFNNTSALDSYDSFSSEEDDEEERIFRKGRKKLK